VVFALSPQITKKNYANNLFSTGNKVFATHQTQGGRLNITYALEKICYILFFEKFAVLCLKA